MKQKNKSNFQRIQQYQISAEQYYDNSKEILNRNELAKAGELLWGAVAETAKALHLRDTDVPLNTHSQIKEFLFQLHIIYRRKELKTWKNSAELLHVNFYESFLEGQTFREHYQNAERLFAFLRSKLVPKKKKNSRLDSDKN